MTETFTLVLSDIEAHCHTMYNGTVYCEQMKWPNSGWIEVEHSTGHMLQELINQGWEKQ